MNWPLPCSGPRLQERTQRYRIYSDTAEFASLQEGATRLQDRYRPSRNARTRGSLWDGKTLAAWIQQQYDVQLGVRQCQRIFRQLGYRLRKPRPALARSDPEQQQMQEKRHQAMMLDPNFDLWATDEMHFQQHGSRCRMWVPPETKDPVLLHHPTRNSVGYFGAVRIRDGGLCFRREQDKFNAQTFFAFAKMLRRLSVHSGRRVVVITDNARYHHA